MVEFTTQERERMGRIFSSTLFSKMVTVIRDAILNEIKCIAKIKEIVAASAPTLAEFQALKAEVEYLSDKLSGLEARPQPAKDEIPEGAFGEEPEEEDEEEVGAESAETPEQPKPEAKPAEPAGTQIEPPEDSIESSMSTLFAFDNKEDQDESE